MAARITQGQFEQQVKNARKQWPFIEDIERKHGMPAGFLYAVGSRETNLRNILGDGGNGVGVWQRDKRWWPIDNSYLKDVRKQAQDAAELLSANKRALGDWRKAASAYNAGLGAVQKALKAGKSADSVTTGRDYGSDVMSRLAFYKPAVKASKGATTTVAKSKSTGYLTDLAAIARRTGYPVVEQPGWRTRGHGSFLGVRSVIAHHDTGKHRPDQFNTVIQTGHSTLAGPLSQFALRRDGTIHVVAAGVSWHAGNNINDSLYGNYYSIGIEAGNDGVGEPWPTRQYNAYVALCGELAKAFDLPVSRIMGHKEIAPSRKIDPTFNMGQFRSRVTQYLKKPNGGGSAAPSTPEYYEDYPMLLPAGGKLKKGGATALRWETVTVPVLREHDLIIACRTGVHIGTINTWKYITKNQAEQRWGVSNKRPGGVGALTKNAWVHGNTALSLIVPRGVGVLHIAYASETPVSVTIAPRK